jgi:hypothetical protein
MHPGAPVGAIWLTRVPSLNAGDVRHDQIYIIAMRGAREHTHYSGTNIQNTHTDDADKWIM